MGIVRTRESGARIQRARQLRADDTNAETRLWTALRDRRLGGWKWRRQAPRGPFVLDFLCSEARLVLELDGGQHAKAEAVDYDARRTAYLERQGLRVLRFWNSEVLTNRSGVCLTILQACGGERNETKPLSPRGRG
jgi:adenine-specific DNA-methyltransferase